MSAHSVTTVRKPCRLLFAVCPPNKTVLPPLRATRIRSTHDRLLCCPGRSRSCPRHRTIPIPTVLSTNLKRGGMVEQIGDAFLRPRSRSLPFSFRRQKRGRHAPIGNALYHSYQAQVMYRSILGVAHARRALVWWMGRKISAAQGQSKPAAPAPRRIPEAFFTGHPAHHSGARYERGHHRAV